MSMRLDSRMKVLIAFIVAILLFLVCFQYMSITEDNNQRTSTKSARSYTLETRKECWERLRKQAAKLTDATSEGNWNLFKTDDADTERKRIFQKIYNDKSWGGGGSGSGSHLSTTIHFRCAFNELVRAFEIDTIVDLPCGDFHWMEQFMIDNPQINYIGVDIAPQVIKRHQDKFANVPNLEFHNLDLVDVDIFQKLKQSSKWGKNVLVMTRQSLEHNAIEDAKKVMDKINTSGAQYLLTSIELRASKNVRPQGTSYRYAFYNYMREPFNFPNPIQIVHDHLNTKHMAMWSLPMKYVDVQEVGFGKHHGLLEIDHK